MSITAHEARHDPPLEPRPRLLALAGWVRVTVGGLFFWGRVMAFETDERTAERLQARLEERDGCLLYTGPLDRDGYGKLWVICGNGRPSPRRTHQIAWQIVHGPVTDGRVLDHLCHTQSNCPGGKTCIHRRCCNPDHLELVTRRTNLERGIPNMGVKPGTRYKRNPHPFEPGTKRRTRCVNGHPWDDVYIDPQGRRCCNECRRMCRRKKPESSAA